MIRKLPQEVINQIAAGEVIQRPVNVIKELVENSIDAHATQINITIHAGGMKLIEIIDNGDGIRVEDYDLLCARFATSKIKQFNDLRVICSFGFRGEALASLSYVSKLVISSRHKQDIIGYEATYKNQKIIQGPTKKPSNIGTTIKASQLFFNIQNRRTSLNPLQQKKRILKLLSHFSLHYPSIRFILQSEKGDESLPNIPKNNQNLTKAQAKMKLFQYITKLSFDKFMYVPETKVDESEQFIIQAILSKLNSCKGKTALININNRIVESPEITKAIDSAYSLCYQSIHEQMQNYYVYLNLQIDPRKIDCNVHPTKKAVGLFGSSSYTQKLTQLILNKIKKQSAIKVLMKTEARQQCFDDFRKKIDILSSQPLLTQFSQNSPSKQSGKSIIMTGNKQGANSKQSKNIYAFEKNRTDSKQLPLQYFLNKTQPKLSAQQVQFPKSLPGKAEQQQRQINKKIVKIQFEYCDKLQKNNQIKAFFQQITYVGCYGLNYILIHYQNQLYMMNIVPFTPIFIQNRIKQNGLILKKVQKQIHIKEALQKFINKTHLLPNYQPIYQWVVNNCEALGQKFGIIIEKNKNEELLEVTYYPCLDEIFTLCYFDKIQTELTYLLCRIYNNLLTRESSEHQQYNEKFIEYFLMSQFKSSNNSQVALTPFNQQISKYFKNTLIPILKTKSGVLSRDPTLPTPLKQIQNKHMKIMLDLKDVYKIFERC